MTRHLLSTLTKSTAYRHCEEERRSNLLIISKIYNWPTIQIFIIFNVAQSLYDSLKKSVIGRRNDEAIYSIPYHFLSLSTFPNTSMAVFTLLTT